MKKLQLFCLIVCYGLGLPSALADHDLVFINSVIKFNDDSCAIELEIFGDNQDGFTDQDNLQVDGVLLTDFTSLVDSGINDAGGNHNTGARILAVSNAFRDNVLAGDLSFSNDHCAAFDAQAVFSYFIDGADLIDSIDASQVSGFGENNTAIVKDNENADPKFLNLEGDTLVIENNREQAVVIGTNSPGGGCSLMRETDKKKAVRLRRTAVWEEIVRVLP